MGKIIEAMTPHRDTGIGVRVETDQGMIVLTILEVETGIEMDGFNKELDLCPMTEKDLGQHPIQE